MNIQLWLKTGLVAAKSLVALLNSRFLGDISSSILHEKSKQILIYLDKGVSLQSAYGSMFYTQLLFSDEYDIKFANADYLLGNKLWESETALLIFPGGRARPYYDSLKATWKKAVDAEGIRRLEDVGEGNKRIQHFVDAGGAFLGICAGAYYASSVTIFEKQSPLEVLDEGPLKFFPGAAIGPAYGNMRFSYWNKRGVQAAQIKSMNNLSQSMHVYFNGGCFLSLDNKNNSVEVMARYDDIPEKPAAVIALQVGKGRVVLSGVHFEIAHWMIPIYSFLNPDFSKKMSLSESTNFLFFDHTLQKLLAPQEACKMKTIFSSN